MEEIQNYIRGNMRWYLRGYVAINYIVASIMLFGFEYEFCPYSKHISDSYGIELQSTTLQHSTNCLSKNQNE